MNLDTIADISQNNWLMRKILFKIMKNISQLFNQHFQYCFNKHFYFYFHFHSYSHSHHQLVSIKSHSDCVIINSAKHFFRPVITIIFVVMQTTAFIFTSFLAALFSSQSLQMTFWSIKMPHLKQKTACSARPIQTFYS